MSNRRLSKLLSMSCIVVLGANLHAYAATLEVGTLSAQTDGQAPSTATYSTTPYTTPITSTVTDASSTVAPDSTGLVFKGTFTQSANQVIVNNPIPATPGATPTAAGAFAVEFTANTGDTYSLFGGVTPVDGEGTLAVSLYDNSTSSSIYSYANTGSVAITADSTGGPTAGTLAAGDYTFTLDSSLAGSVFQSFISSPTPDSLPTATLSGSGGITLVSTGVVPEASAPVLLLVCGVGLLLAARRRTRTI